MSYDKGMRAGHEGTRLEETLLELELRLFRSVVDRCGSAVDTIGRQHKFWYARVETIDRSEYANTLAFGRPIIETMSEHSKV